MKAMNGYPGFGSVRFMVLLGFMALGLQGCAGGAITGSVYAVSGGVAAKLHRERTAFRQNLKKDYSSYEKLFAESGCNPEQYRIQPAILEYLRDSAPTDDGYAEAQDILMETYADKSLSRDVRAHALYIAALTEAQKEDGSRTRARDFLKKVKDEFPGTHDCAVDQLLAKGGQI